MGRCAKARPFAGDTPGRWVSAIAERGGPENLTCERALAAIYRQPVARALDFAGRVLPTVVVLEDRATFYLTGSGGRSSTERAIRQNGRRLFEIDNRSGRRPRIAVRTPAASGRPA